MRAQDCPYTYRRDLIAGTYRLPWEGSREKDGRYVMRLRCAGTNHRTDEPKRVLQTACLSRAQDFGGFFHIPRLDPQNGAETSLAGRCSGHSSQVDLS